MAKISYEEVENLENFIARIKEASNSKDLMSAASQVRVHVLVMLTVLTFHRTLERIHVPFAVPILFQCSLYLVNINPAGLWLTIVTDTVRDVILAATNI